MKHSTLISAIALALSLANTPAADWEASPAQQTAGTFWRLHWYERGLTNGNPAYETRFRINSPEASTIPWIAVRTEARENGMMLIKAEEDLLQLTGADLHLEMWGGHPGTANKRVTVNGRGTYYLPRVGTEEGHCTYFYPRVSLRPSDLVNGYNAFQFAVDQGTTFWGHAIVDNACLRIALTNHHADLEKLKLGGFTASVKAEAIPGGEGFKLSLDSPPGMESRISTVDFQGWYHGYDENGNQQTLDWHGFTKKREPLAILGTKTSSPFTVSWDISMLVAQKEVAARAVVRFKDAPDLVFLTAPVSGLEIPERAGSRVFMVAPHDLPRPFWSRAGQKKQCTLDLDIDPARIERATLHIVTWTGGAGTVKEYFKLNGSHYPVAEEARHELIYSHLSVDPKKLRRGLNTVELLSDTEHHGIEVCLPGPALAVRYRLQQ